MSVKEARKLLGKEHARMTDDEVAELIEHTHELAKLALDVARDKIPTGKRDEKTEKSTNQPEEIR